MTKSRVFLSLKWRMLLLRWQVYPGKDIAAIGIIAIIGINLALVGLMVNVFVNDFNVAVQIALMLLLIGVTLFANAILALVVAELGALRKEPNA